MKQWERAVMQTPAVGRLALFVYRTLGVARYHWATLRNVVTWLFSSNETTNFTYAIEDSNKRHLACLISEIFELEYPTVMAYFDEIEQDHDLQRHITETTKRSNRAKMADTHAQFGRRLGWYAIARATKPKIIVETGVDKGLGACLLTSALKKNCDEGYPGQYFGTDINPAAGYLLSGVYAAYGEILYGDSIDSLTKFPHQIDLFVNDSDHSAEYEGKEYRVVADKLSEEAVVLGDNSDITDELLDWSLSEGRKFVFFAEKPAGHWFAGGGIGISVSA